MVAHALMSLFSVSVLAPSIVASAGDRTELRLRNGATSAQFDFITAPRLELALTTYRTNWRLAYSPMLTRLDLADPDGSLLLIQSGSLNTDLALGPRTRLSFSEYASYGTQNFRALAVGATAPVDSSGGVAPIPGQGGLAPNGAPLAAQAAMQDRTTRFGSLYAGAGLSHEFHPRWLGRVTTSGMTSGGLDATSQAALPRMKQLTGSVALTHGVSERDSLTLQVEGQHGRTTPGATASIVSEDLTWARRLSRTLNGSVTAGHAYVSVILPTGEPLTRHLPLAAASIEITGTSSGWRNSLSLREDYAPYMDRLRGTISQRTVTTLTARTNKNRLTLTASFYASASTYSVGPVSLRHGIGATESVGYQLNRHWSLELGARQSSQSYSGFSQIPFLWAFYSAVTYTTGQWPL